MSTGQTKHSPSVLIADDDALTRDALARTLRRAGLHVRTASDGSDVEDDLEREPADILVLDLQMPGKNGFEVIRSLKSRYNPDIHNPRVAPKIIVVSGRDEPDTEQFARHLGADAYAVKPLLGQDLLALVRQFVGNRKL
ncbi:MAG TPA: response regulator [Candidatus Acidoferrales bacterium]|nr:response regulator [Candidatus Acidoferrales bacterium]